MIKSCQDQDGDPNLKAPAKYTRLLDDFIGNIQAEGLALGTVSNHVKSVKALFRCNGIKLGLAHTLSKRAAYSDRAPTPEELQHIIDLADLRESHHFNASPSRIPLGAPVRLQYRHVARDIGKMIPPTCIHVEDEITKGIYQDYDMFI